MSEYCHDGDWRNTPKIFTFHDHEAPAGAWADITTSKDADTVPTYAIPAWIGADKLIEGILQRLHFQFDWANAVTLDKIRIYREASAGDAYAIRMYKIYETPDGVNHADNTEYDYVDLNIPFRLANPEILYVSFEWSGACGNIQGFIGIEGERKT